MLSTKHLTDCFMSRLGPLFLAHARALLRPPRCALPRLGVDTVVYELLLGPAYGKTDQVNPLPGKVEHEHLHDLDDHGHQNQAT